MSALLGAGGIGLVWGWWAVLVAGRSGPRARSAAVVLVATALGAGALRLLTGGWPAAMAFVAAAALAAYLHSAWLHHLRTSAPETHNDPPDRHTTL